MRAPLPPLLPQGETCLARRYTVSGRVQGVGFRPFVFRLAQRHAIRGRVANGMGQVVIHAEAPAAVLDAFYCDLLEQAPAIAQPIAVDVSEAPVEDIAGFAILPSDRLGASDIHLVADLPVCTDCLREMAEPGNRRYRYPFINCTQCGPRYSLIRQLPYDRHHTSMASFTLCAACAAEYNAPANRRFHAEPNACPDCGPQLAYQQGETHISEPRAALQACNEQLQAGGIVAIKGLSGYHLVCDARNDAAVTRLRQRKLRAAKPFAIMLSAQQLPRYVDCNEHELSVLQGPSRPILLLPARDNDLSPAIAPGLRELGVMLPYTPLQYLLLDALGAPLLLTSANLSGEPVLTDNAEVEARLGKVADAFLHHDREIVRPADDPVLKVIAGKPRPIRIGRGNAPLELRLPFSLPRPVLACGGQMKNTIALAWDNRITISPHIGDLDSPRSLQVFEQAIADLQCLYAVTAEAVICDAHHGYASSRWAQASGLPVHETWHHHAHAAVLHGEYPQAGRWLVFSWDGTGLGTDHSLWGGEALLGMPGSWQRLASLRPFRLPGAERASREPWRSAAALCWESAIDYPLPGAGAQLLRQAWQQQFNCPLTSAVGRLFDAAAALLGVCEVAAYEAQAPMLLESIAATHNTTAGTPLELPMQRESSGLLRSDWSELLPMLRDTGKSVVERAWCLHASLAQLILRTAQRARDEHGDFSVGLCGGVFQNRLLTEMALHKLQRDGFEAYLPERVPVNDAGLCYGQVIEAMRRAAQ